MGGTQRERARRIKVILNADDLGRNEITNAVIFDRQVGARPDEATIAEKDVDQLRSSSKPVARRRLPKGREGGKTVIIPFVYDDVVAGKNLETNILLRRGDVVVVP